MKRIPINRHVKHEGEIDGKRYSIDLIIRDDAVEIDGIVLECGLEAGYSNVDFVSEQAAIDAGRRTVSNLLGGVVDMSPVAGIKSRDGERVE